MFSKKEPSIKARRKEEKKRLHLEMLRLDSNSDEYQRRLDQLKQLSEIEQMEGSKAEKVLPTVIGAACNIAGILIVTHWEDLGHLVSSKALNLAYKVKS